MLSITSVVPLVVLPLLVTSHTQQPPQCLYQCDQIEGGPTETGTFPPGVVFTVVPQNSTPGGSKTLDPCDTCDSCKQRFKFTFDPQQTSYVAGSVATGGQPTFVGGQSIWWENLTPFCDQTHEVTGFLMSQVEPPVFVYTVRFTLECDCPL